MLPVLFKIGPINVYSFGLMMGIAFLVANYFFVKEFRRRGMPENVAAAVTLIALAGGVFGSKMFSIIEHWESFVADPIGQLFSGAGLTFHGGLIVATILIYFYIRHKGLPFLRVADAAAPSLIIAYGIGRIGCQLAGDGDYGIPSNLPWAMGYPHGTVPTLSETNLALKQKFIEMFPDRVVPADIAVHPAPIYEFIAALAIFGFLWYLRKRSMPMGMLFAVYLITSGLERLMIEFIRLNPLYLGLSQAQWIAIGMIILGGGMLWWMRNHPPDTLPISPEQKRATRRTGSSATVRP